MHRLPVRRHDSGRVSVESQDFGQVYPYLRRSRGLVLSDNEVRRFASLPKNARNYVERIAELARTPVALVSVGPERESTIDIA